MSKSNAPPSSDAHGTGIAPQAYSVPSLSPAHLHDHERGVFESLYLDDAAKKNPSFAAPEYVNGLKFLVNGTLEDWTGEFAEVYSPIYDRVTGRPVSLGRVPMMKPEDSLRALDAAVKAFDHGRGQWPTSSPAVRIAAVEKFMKLLAAKRNEMAHLLMWEICKTRADAEKEVDRTIEYIAATVKELKALENRESTFMQDSGIFAQVRRAPLGTVLSLGPFNYPLNETYTTLIPALITGNCVVMKLPRVGTLVHCATLEMFRDCFPPGVINVVSGSGRETLPPIMKTALVDVFAFIGSSSAADALQKSHPKPHRLRVCLGLEAKNPAIVMPDADLQNAVDECVLGALSFNGQRCTAIKMILVHKRIERQFIERFVQKVDSLQMGLPWLPSTRITPLPEEGKPGYLRELIADALAKGAQVINPRGNQFDRTFVSPTVLFPTNQSMRVFREEQFGPLVPIASFETLDEVYQYLADSHYGQQASVFSKDPASVGPLVDVLVNQVSRVNLNSQCQRGPDSFPFTARKDSAYGTLSIADALRVFTLRSLVAGKTNSQNEQLVNSIIASRQSKFLRLDYLF